jgi:hypothetical protein
MANAVTPAASVTVARAERISNPVELTRNNLDIANKLVSGKDSETNVAQTVAQLRAELTQFKGMVNDWAGNTQGDRRLT